MKKTIVILLVLVIGMAGVFAETSASADLKLTTAIAEYSLMAITSDNAAFAWNDTTWEGGENPNATSIYSTNAMNVDSDSESKAYLQATTNRRAPTTISMTAKPLSSPGVGGGQVTSYLPYEVTCFDVTSATGNDGKFDSDKKTVVQMSWTEGNGPYLFNQQIMITITDNARAAAAAGTYNGVVVFEISTT